jgi:hypothetical protein
MYWAHGKPSLATFVNRRSFTMFDLLGAEHEDLAFLKDSVDRYPCKYSYTTTLLWYGVNIIDTTVVIVSLSS